MRMSVSITAAFMLLPNTLALPEVFARDSVEPRAARPDYTALSACVVDCANGGCSSACRRMASTLRGTHSGKGCYEVCANGS
ncbi:hypothetical protein QBC34DRAFT_404044 [Podospora aff. communis PSN243]|uniref:Uncharacterized protein n=1 Tax=Podospora aff. communis PSN243 TaxID=3040156 RepID=A0AAV9GQ77_9PEZI|nr:hypothetical protein QBC34DRAFT_404044 [Podospora aff. communis PSN243]